MAKRAHKNQKDRAGNPYNRHLKRVAEASRHAGPAAEAAAWLHDTVEDTKVTITDIEERFPKPVVKVVELLTRKPSETYVTYIDY